MFDTDLVAVVTVLDPLSNKHYAKRLSDQGGGHKISLLQAVSAGCPLGRRVRDVIGSYMHYSS